MRYKFNLKPEKCQKVKIDKIFLKKNSKGRSKLSHSKNIKDKIN